MPVPALPSVSTCTHCHEAKPADQFYIRKSGPYAGRPMQWCKQCFDECRRRNYERRKTSSGSQEPLVGTRACRTCGRELPLSEFTPNHYRADGRHTVCRQCSNEAFRAARKNDYYVLRHYGLTVAEYDALLAAQGGVCAICGKPEVKTRNDTGNAFRLAVDHDHETGRVRALLCHACNAGIGQFNHDPELMAVAIRYLLQHKAKTM